MSGGKPGTLFIVSTPIGNMGDFSFRAVEVLRSVDAILAEDTRHSRPLLDRYEIKTRLIPYHEHNEAKSTPGIVARLVSGESIALISDAGTPLLSDPGSRLTAAAIAEGVTVTSVPGASAMLAALVASGIAADRFTFLGFLPRKGKERGAAIGLIGGLEHTAIIYESPQRLAGTLAELASAGLGHRQGAVCREITKRFEETRRGTLAELAAYYDESPPRGEIVVVVAGEHRQPPSDDRIAERARELASTGRSVRDVASQLAAELGIPRNAAYRAARETHELSTPDSAHGVDDRRDSSRARGRSAPRGS